MNKFEKDILESELGLNTLALKDEENEEDEFTSFVLKKLELKGKPPIEITEANFFIINYHNFPRDIILNNERIN